MRKQVFQLLQNRLHHQRVSATMPEFEFNLKTSSSSKSHFDHRGNNSNWIQSIFLIPLFVVLFMYCEWWRWFPVIFIIIDHLVKRAGGIIIIFGFQNSQNMDKDKTYGGDWCPDDHYHILKFESCPRQLCVAVSLFTNIRVEIWHCYLIRTYTRVNC